MKNPPYSSYTTEKIIPDELKQIRIKSGLTQTQAAALVGVKIRQWQRWEAGDSKINQSLIELFLIKINR